MQQVDLKTLWVYVDHTTLVERGTTMMRAKRERMDKGKERKRAREYLGWPVQPSGHPSNIGPNWGCGMLLPHLRSRVHMLVSSTARFIMQRSAHNATTIALDVDSLDTCVQTAPYSPTQYPRWHLLQLPRIRTGVMRHPQHLGVPRHPARRNGHARPPAETSIP